MVSLPNTSACRFFGNEEVLESDYMFDGVHLVCHDIMFLHAATFLVSIKNTHNDFRSVQCSVFIFLF